MFKPNESTADRVLRVAIGVAALTAFFLLPDAGWRWWLLIGIVPLVTGIVGWCPLYRLLGLTTRRDRPA